MAVLDAARIALGSRAAILTTLNVAAIIVVVVIFAIVSTAPVASQEPPSPGSEVEVVGAVDCLNIRASWGKDSPVLACVPDGTRARTKHDRAVVDDGETWWALAGLGWTASRYLRVVGPPIPDLQSSAEPRPILPGLIAFVGDDGNVWTTRPDGSQLRQITTDAVPSGGSYVGYMNLSWSPQGRYVVFQRFGATAASSTFLFDAATGQIRSIEPDPSRKSYSPYWLPDGTLAVAFILPASRQGPPGDLDPAFDGGIEVINVATDARRDVLPWSAAQDVGIYELGPASPDGSRLAFETGGYEKVGPACSVDLTSGAHRCTPEVGWTPRGWINNRELVILYNPYSGPGNPPRNNVLDADTGATHEATSAELEFYERPLTYSEATGEVRIGAAQSFRIPVQHNVHFLGEQPVSPGQSAFVFAIDGTRWVGLLDGSGRAWRLVEGTRGTPRGAAVWQPTALPPVLLVHGCGGGLATWTETGWLKDAVEVQQLQSGAAQGRLYRGTWDRLPGATVYAIDYHASEGSFRELAGLVSTALDQIRSENGDVRVEVATHSMGGVITQFYIGGLSPVGRYRGDIASGFLIAPPTRGAFAAEFEPDALVCPQSSALEVGSDELRELEADPPLEAPLTIASGTALWLPFAGHNDGIVAYDDIAPVGVDVQLIDEDNGIHADAPLLPNFLIGLCETVPGRASEQRCVNVLRIDSVKATFVNDYLERLP